MPDITFLGTSGSVVTKDRMCAGVLFEDKLIDVGFGVLTNIVRSRIDLDSINDIYISHTHSDHIGDFTGLIWAMAMENRTRRLRVISSSGVAATLEKVLELQSTPRTWLKFKIDFVRPQEADVKCTTTIHDPETLAYRLAVDGCDFVYGADSARSEKLGQFARGCDLLIHDATFLEGQESVAALTNHSTAADAGSTAKIARVKKLVLTHIAPSNAHDERKYLSEAAKLFDGEILMAKDKLKIAL